jgi:HEAT repeat protein
MSEERVEDATEQNFPEREPIVAGPPPPDAAEPMTPKLLARLFVVPLLIVVMIVGCSVAVVLLFGWISSSRQESIEKLVARIEAGAGDKIMSVAMLPKDREVWQAAMELAGRLQSEDPAQLGGESPASIAARLGAVLEKTRKIEQTQMGQEMQRFLLTALGGLGQPESVSLLIAFARDESQPVEVRQDAVAALILMKEEPAARQAWPELAGLLESPQPILRLYTTMAIGALAQRGDETAIQALRRAYYSEDREVQWNAALALAKLGDEQVSPLLADMLSRAYWERIPVEGVGGSDAARRLTPTQVEGYLIFAVDAARALASPELKPAVEELTRDPSPQVRDHAVKALKDWPSAASAPSARGLDLRGAA